MIVEQRDYHIYTGKLKEVLRLYETEGIIIQKDVLGNLIGWFTTEIGALSSICAMWGYENFADREQRRAALAADERCPMTAAWATAGCSPRTRSTSAG